MSYYNTVQFIWQDSTGEHMFVSSEPYSVNNAITLAIAMQANQSATHIRIVEIVMSEGGTRMTYVDKFKWGVQAI